MKSSNIGAIHLSFGIQAQAFDNASMHFSNREYLDYSESRIDPEPTDSILEVAAGTCACGRSLAPFAQTVTCLDTTPAMLEVGKREAEKNGLNNMVFIQGRAEDLPFPDNCFDIVMSRLAFHHFPNIERPFQEMARVLKTDGKLVLIDMEAPEEHLRATRDKIESMRDPSHIKNLNKAELLKLFSDRRLSPINCEKTIMPVSLENWMELTRTPVLTQKKIISYMKSDMAGEIKTGFSPYLNENKIFFHQHWIMVIGKKMQFCPFKSSTSDNADPCFWKNCSRSGRSAT